MPMASRILSRHAFFTAASGSSSIMTHARSSSGRISPCSDSILPDSSSHSAASSRSTCALRYASGSKDLYSSRDCRFAFRTMRSGVRPATEAASADAAW